MIVVRLMGGLGNQMFQCAAARALALRHGVEARFDLSYLEDPPPDATPREYALSCFRLNVKRTTSDDFCLIEAEPSTPDSRGRNPSRVSPHRLHPVKQAGFGFDPRYFDAGPDTLLVGYWTSEDYFRDAETVIRDDFTFRNPPDGSNRELAAEIGRDSVSVHVRRGDYVTNPSAGVLERLSPDWYAAAAAEMMTHVDARVFFVFSDDPDWCRRHLRLPGDARFVEQNLPDAGHEDLRLMSLFRNHIIANSSFSWWGAWLYPHPDKVVIAPRRWFTDPGIDTSRLTPPGWTRLGGPATERRSRGRLRRRLRLP